MSAPPIPAPDWFEQLWREHQHRLPFLLQNETGKRMVRDLLGIVLESLKAQAGSASGVSTVIAFARIQAMLKGCQGVLDAPDPTPEQVADAVERLVERMKP
jgi:hypothetical protein